MKKVHEMTLKEKIGQVLVAGFHSTNYDQQLDILVKEKSLGNVVLFTRNIKDIKQLHTLTESIHKEIMDKTGVIPFITIDQEGGMVTRIMDEATFCPGNMTLGATKPENAYRVGQIMGEELAALGINMNLAPSLDVNNNPNNPVIGVRSYSDNPEAVSKYGINFIKGLQEKGIIATAKHFPGHGDTALDSHKSLPIIPHGKERLEKIELYPFKKAIEAGVWSIMSAHVFFEAYETGNLPGTLSQKVLTDLLRNELGFEGIIISDCMEMKAIDDNYTTAKGVLMGLKAGLDLAIISHSLDKQLETFQLIEEAVLSGDFPIEELDKKVERILKYKEISLAALNDKFFNRSFEEKYDIITNKDSKEFSSMVVESSLTKVKGKDFYPNRKTLVIATEPFATTIAEDEVSTRSIVDVIKKDKLPMDTLKIKVNISDEEIEEVIQKAKEYQQVVVCTYNANSFKNQAKLINKLDMVIEDLFVISTRNPYDILKFKQIKNYFCLYEYTPNSVKTISKFLNKELIPMGKLPVNLNNTIKIGASIYVGLDEYPLKKNLDYLNELKKSKIDLVFISAHIPEMRNGFEYEIIEVCKKAKELGIKVVLDVSKPMINQFEIPEVYSLRLDYGFNNDEIVEMCKQSKFLVELNASTLTESQLIYFKSMGVDLNRIRVSHNFYPKPYTGLSHEEVIRRNELFKKYGLVIMGYIPSNNQKRPPIYEGLPTVESHRHDLLENTLTEMKLLGFDEICFGDSYASFEELKLAVDFDYDIISIPVIVKKGISNIELDILKKIHRNRIDQSIYFKRSSTRIKDYIKPVNMIERLKGFVTIDNEKFGRYQGETSIVTRDLEADERVNVVGRIVASDFLINSIKPGQKFKFNIIGEE